MKKSIRPAFMPENIIPFPIPKEILKARRAAVLSKISRNDAVIDENLRKLIDFKLYDLYRCLEEGTKPFAVYNELSNCIKKIKGGL